MRNTALHTYLHCKLGVHFDESLGVHRRRRHERSAIPSSRIAGEVQIACNGRPRCQLHLAILKGRDPVLKDQLHPKTAQTSLDDRRKLRWHGVNQVASRVHQDHSELMQRPRLETGMMSAIYCNKRISIVAHFLSGLRIFISAAVSTPTAPPPPMQMLWAETERKIRRRYGGRDYSWGARSRQDGKADLRFRWSNRGANCREVAQPSSSGAVSNRVWQESWDILTTTHHAHIKFDGLVVIYSGSFIGKPGASPDHIIHARLSNQVIYRGLMGCLRGYNSTRHSQWDFLKVEGSDNSDVELFELDQLGSQLGTCRPISND